MHGSYAVYLIGPRVPLGCCACAGAFAVAAGSMVTSSSEVLAAAHKVEVDRKREAAIQEQLVSTHHHSALATAQSACKFITVETMELIAVVLL